MSYAEFQLKDQKTSAPGKTSHEAELSQLTAEGRQNSQPGDLTTRLFRSLTSHPSLLCRQHRGTPSLCSFLRAFLNILSFYCSLRTLSILTWSETELLREDWEDIRRYEWYFNSLAGQFGPFLSILFLSDSLYCIPNWVFFQLAGIQLVICWCELSKGRRELNYMWQSGYDKGALSLLNVL